MAIEFTVIRDGRKNWIYMSLGSNDRAVDVDANALSVPNATTYSMVSLSGPNLTLTGTGESRAIDISVPFLRRSFAMYNINGKIQLDIDMPSTFAGQYGITTDVGVLNITYDIASGAAPTGILYATSTIISNNSSSMNANLKGSYLNITNSALITKSINGQYNKIIDNLGSKEVICGFFEADVNRPTNGGAGTVRGLESTVVLDEYAGQFGNCANLEGLRVTAVTTASCTAGLHKAVYIRSAYNSLSTVGISYGLYIDNDINEGLVDNMIYMSYPRAPSTTMPAGKTWRGVGLNTGGVICAAGQTYYGIDLVMNAMTTGGTINGIRCIVPNLIPAMVLGDGTGTLTFDFGASNHPNIDSSTGRIYFGTQAGGSAGADDIYCHGVLQTAPWAENTWDELDDVGLLSEINNAVNEGRAPQLPEAFIARYENEGYYDKNQMEALMRGAIIQLSRSSARQSERIAQLEATIDALATRCGG